MTFLGGIAIGAALTTAHNGEIAMAPRIRRREIVGELVIASSKTRLAIAGKVWF